MTRVIRSALAGLVLLVVGTAFLSPAASQEADGGGLVLRRVDTRDFPEVRLVAMATGGAAEGDVTVREDGEEVTGVSVASLSATGTRLGVVFAVDVSESMREGAALEEAKAAVRAMVATLPGDAAVGLVAIGDDPRLGIDLTTNRPRLDESIGDLGPGGGSVIWDGVSRAVEMLVDRQELQANVVLISDGTDTGSLAAADRVVASAVEAKAAVFTIGLRSAELDEGSLVALAERTGAGHLGVDAPAGIAPALASVGGALTSQIEVTYESAAQRRSLALEVSAGDDTAFATANVGTISEGRTTALQARGTDSSFLGSGGARLLGMLLGAGAVAMAGFAGFSLLTRSESGIDSVLRPYAEVATVDSGEGGFVQSHLVQRAVAMTEDFAIRRGFLPRVAGALERADLPLRAAEALFFNAAGAIVVGGLAFALLAPLMALLVLAAAALGPAVVVSFKAKLRRRSFTSSLPDMLQLLAGSLRAGYSLLQGVEAVSQEVRDPMGQELRRVIVEARLGRPVEEALEDVGERMDSPDFAWAVMAIRIQREVGGNLSELLMTVAETMQERERLRREVKGLTAEGRMSAMVLGFLPVGLGGAMYVMNKEYIQQLFEVRSGQIALGVAIVVACFGFWWMKKIIDIKI